MSTATIFSCTECQGLSVTVPGARAAATVPGTGVLDCAHIRREESGTVDVAVAVHLALSTLLRSGVLDDEQRHLAHRIQEWMGVPQSMWTVRKLPYLLTDGYGVSSAGLATARVLASRMGKTSTPDRAFFWLAAASIMRRRIGGAR